MSGDGHDCSRMSREQLEREWTAAQKSAESDEQDADEESEEDGER